MQAEQLQLTPQEALDRSGGQNCPAMDKDDQVFISASTVIVCGCFWDDLTLGKVAFYTKAILEATGSWNMSAGSTLHSLATSAL